MFKKIIITTVAASMMVAGAAQVSAQDVEPIASDDSITIMQDDSGRDGQRGGRFGGDYFDGAMIELVETYTGLSAREVMQTLRSEDTTLAALIEANGQSVDDFINEAVGEVESKIDEAVANGDLDADRADMMKENLTEGITAMVNGERPLRNGHPGGRGILGDTEIVALIEEYTGMTSDELREAMQNGETTLANLIEANDQSVDGFVSEAVTLAEARIDEAVTNGNLDADRADMMKENLAEGITAMINAEHPLRGGRPGGMGFFNDAEIVTLVEGYTGMTAAEVREAMQDGETTLANLIEANGQSVDDFIAAATTIAESNFSERFTQGFTAFVNGERPNPDGFGGRGVRPGAFGDDSE